MRQFAAPLAIVVDELLDIVALAERPEKEVLEHGVVQYHDSRTLERPLVNLAVQLIVAKMVERNVGPLGRDLDVATAAKRPEQRGSVIGDTGVRGRKRRLESDGHGFFRLPNSAVPTRMCVAPSSMATSKSCDMPIEIFGKSNCRANSRRRRK